MVSLLAKLLGLTFYNSNASTGHSYLIFENVIEVKTEQIKRNPNIFGTFVNGNIWVHFMSKKNKTNTNLFGLIFVAFLKFF